jgi:hypothetical protein
MKKQTIVVFLLCKFEEIIPVKWCFIVQRHSHVTIFGFDFYFGQIGYDFRGGSVGAGVSGAAGGVGGVGATAVFCGTSFFAFATRSVAKNQGKCATQKYQTKSFHT